MDLDGALSSATLRAKVVKLWLAVVRFCCKDGFVCEEEFLKTMVHAIAVEAMNRSLAG